MLEGTLQGKREARGAREGQGAHRDHQVQDGTEMPTSFDPRTSEVEFPNVTTRPLGMGGANWHLETFTVQKLCVHTMLEVSKLIRFLFGG